MNTLIDCINDPAKKIDGELKRKILAEAAMGKKLKDPNYIPSEAEVVEALQKIQKRNNRNKIEKANDIVKLQKTLQELEFWKKELPNVNNIASKFLLSYLDRDISNVFKGRQSGASDLQFRFVKERENLLAPTLIYYEQLKDAEKIDFQEIIINIKDGNQEKNTPYPQDMIRQAEDFVKVYDIYEDMKIKDMNEAGIIIDPIEDYHFETTHSQLTIANFTEQEYIDYNINRIDWERTQTPNGDKMTTESEKAEFLSKFRNAILDRGKDPFKSGGGKTTPRNMMNQMRLLHFNSFGDAVAYKRQFGETDDFLIDLSKSLESQSKLYGISRKLGSNPENNLDIILKHLKNNNELSENQAVRIKELYLYKTGQTNEISNPVLWNLFSGFKNLTYSSIMGSVFVTSYFGDTAAISKTMSQAGLDKVLIPILGSLGKTHKNVLKQFLTNYGSLIRKNPEAKKALSDMITSMDGVLNMNAVMTRFDENFNGFSDNYAKIPEGKTLGIDNKTILKGSEMIARGGEFFANAVFKYTGQVRIQRTMKDVVGHTYMIGINNAKKYNLETLKSKEPKFYDWIINEANFTESEWERFRSKEGDYTFADIRDLDTDLRDRFWKGLHSLQTLGVQEPSDRVKSSKQSFSLSKKKDSIGAMLMDSLFMLKSFILQAVPNLTKRIRISNRQGGLLGAATETTSLFTTMMISTMMMESIKAAINGTTPPDYSDPEYLGKNLTSLIAMSGGLGIISDVLFYDYSKYGGGIGEVLKGPILSNLEEGIKIGGVAVQAPFREDVDVPIYDAIQYFHSMLPFNNYMFTKQLQNTLIKDNLLKLSDAERFEKSQKTFEKNLEENRGQEKLDIDLFD